MTAATRPCELCGGTVPAGNRDMLGIDSRPPRSTNDAEPPCPHRQVRLQSRWTTALADGCCNNCASRSGRILLIEFRSSSVRLCEVCAKELVFNIRMALA